MGELNKKRRRFLEEKSGPRPDVDATERKLYGHDIAAMPGLLKPLIGDTTPAAVVQPADEADK